MMAMMVAATATAFAQAEVVKHAKKLLDKGQLDDALTAVEPALNAGTNEDKATAWNIVCEAYYKKFSNIQ